MSHHGSKWTARSGTRQVRDDDGYALYHETWVEVRDGLGGRWTVTVEDDRIASLTVHADDVKQRDLRSTPLVEIRAVALAHVRAVVSLLDQGYRLEDALDEASAAPSDLMPNGRTTVDKFLADYHAAGPRVRDDGEVDRKPRRQTLSEAYQVSEYTIDKWVRFLRDRGDLPESRINRKKTPGADRAGSQEKDAR